jgi:hypothetical protein
MITEKDTSETDEGKTTGRGSRFNPPIITSRTHTHHTPHVTWTHRKCDDDDYDDTPQHDHLPQYTTPLSSMDIYHTHSHSGRQTETMVGRS